jgi:ketosteroid isomerase-like protein
MSQGNVEIVRVLFAAYMQDDAATVRDLTDVNLVISGRPDQPDVDDFHGYEGLLQSSAQWREVWDEHTFEATGFRDAGDLVFVSAREWGKGRASGVPIESRSTFVVKLSHGKVVRIQIFSTEREALKAVGLAE